ncbi:MAG: ABC transporter ATP-binding protein [Eubacteriales bacterium]
MLNWYQPLDSGKNIDTEGELMNLYYKHAKPYIAYFIMAPLLMLIEVYCDVRIPSLSAEIVNLAVEGGDSRGIILISIQMLTFALVAVAAGIGSSYSATKASVNFCHDLREELFVKIQSFSFDNIDKFSTGSLVTRLTNDVTQVGQIIVMSLRMVFRAPGMLIGAMIMAYSISPDMSIIFFVLTPVLGVIVFLVLNVSYPRFAKLQEKIDTLNTTIQEGLINIRVIKAFTREEFEKNRFEKANHDLKDTSLSAYRINILQRPIMTFAVNMATIAILWFGSKALGKGELQIGDMSAFITYLTQILMSVNMIANVFLQSARSRVSGRRITQVLNANVDISDSAETNADKKVTTGDIRFENVSFKYYANSEEQVLANINLDIKSGQSIGIVGSTGCGKTTLVHLISRLYDVNCGEIFVDGVNVKKYSLKNLRDGVAVVLQNNLLFSGTIRDNLLWGNEFATEEELVRIADYAAAGEFIEKMPEGFDTDLNQRGLNLSGGQKQRLCIARALLKKTKVLILDDSTSAVDTATERKITRHLTEDLQAMTKIIIAQRISSVINCDNIIVMDEGQIVDMGTHAELLEVSSVYREIYNSQMDNGESDNRVLEVGEV